MKYVLCCKDGQHPQCTVPNGRWSTSRASEDEFIMGRTVASTRTRPLICNSLAVYHASLCEKFVNLYRLAGSWSGKGKRECCFKEVKEEEGETDWLISRELRQRDPGTSPVTLASFIICSRFCSKRITPSKPAWCDGWVMESLASQPQPHTTPNVVRLTL